MKRLIAIIAIIAIATPALAGGGAPPVTDGYYTFAWLLPHEPTGTGENAPWPQTLLTYQYTGDQPDLDYLDGIVASAGSPCGWYQIDTYKIDSARDISKLEWIIDKGTLNWPEDSSIYHSSKFMENTECSTTTTTAPSSTTTSTTGTTTTTETSTTTTPNETTTTSVASSTTSPPPTTTSIPGASSTVPSPTPDTLAHTGPGDWVPATVVGGLGLLVLGSLILGLVRSRDPWNQAIRDQRGTDTERPE